MDEYTQGLLERARLRREKLNSQLSQAGVVRTPLQQNNSLNIEPSVPAPLKENVPSTVTQSSNAKSRLQKLTELHTENHDLSAPISQNEDKILEQPMPKTNKCRLGRLNELASTINQWEDDLSHIDLKKTSEPKSKSFPKKTTTVPKEVINASISVTTVSTGSEDKVTKSTATVVASTKADDDKVAFKKKKLDDEDNIKFDRGSPKESKSRLTDASSSPVVSRLEWDQTMLKALESQGFSRTEESKLTYEFGMSPELTPKAVRSPGKSPRISVTKANQNKSSSPRTSGVKPSSFKKSLLSPAKSPNNVKAVSFKTSKPGMKRSPKMGVSALDKESSVLKRAALFEQNQTPVSNSSKVKDPAELPLSERKALFEKNKGEVLLPKVAFATPLPAKLRQSPVKSNKKEIMANRSPVKAFGLGNQVSSIKEKLVEKNLVEATNINLSKLEREKDLEYLRNRWKRKGEMSGYAEDTTGPAPPPPPLPSNNPVLFSPPPPMVPKVSSSPVKIGISPDKVMSPPSYQDSPETLQAVKNVKTIVLSPPKEGNLYPNLSDIEKSDEEQETEDSNSSLNESKTQSPFFNMSFSEILEASKNNSRSPQITNESRVLNEMNEVLDAALADISSSEDDGPTPPKQARGSDCISSASTSFEFTPRREQPTTPLIHSISVYRKQQNTLSSAGNTPMKVVKHEPLTVHEDPKIDETVAVSKKIEALLSEVGKQQTVISQASNALSVCLANIEFSGSEEQVEGERLLLLAGHKRQACLNEVQRLKVEGTIRAKGSNADQLKEQGDLIVSNITIPLKRDALRAMAADESMQYFVCLIKSDERVIASPVVKAAAPHLQGTNLVVPGEVRLEKLYGDFKATVEIYNMVLSKEMLPHHIKYHLPGKKDKKLLTPIKSKKSQSRLVMPNIQSPAGPNAVRTTSFQLCGYVIFSLRELKRTQWTLNKVPYTSPLEGSICMSINSDLRLDDVYRGFLSMFDDVSGLGAWHRRWCLLSSHTLSYWKYPDDETKKVPLGSIDLRSVVTETIGLVSREVCARLHTILLETTRPRAPSDISSLILVLEGDVARVRHLLSADTKEERIEWCSRLNKALALLRAWGCQP